MKTPTHFIKSAALNYYGPVAKSEENGKIKVTITTGNRKGTSSLMTKENWNASNVMTIDQAKKYGIHGGKRHTRKGKRRGSRKQTYRRRR